MTIAKKLLSLAVTAVISFQCVQSTISAVAMEVSANQKAGDKSNSIITDLSNDDLLKKQLELYMQDETDSKVSNYKHMQIIVKYKNLESNKIVKKNIVKKIKDKRIKNLEKQIGIGKEYKNLNKYKNIIENLDTESLGIDVLASYEQIDTEVLTISKADDIDFVIQELTLDENVEYVQENYIFDVMGANANNKSPSQINEIQWAVNNFGQEINGKTGVSGVDINLSDNELSNPSVVVGVIDTGIDTNHQSLSGNFVSGWDFVNNNDSVFDNTDKNNNESHGTKIAGIISASGKINGASENSLIMPLKVFENGSGYTSDIIEAIEYAHKNDVKIINCSFGSTSYNPILKDVMEEYSDMLFVCAAGNSGSDMAVYPAAFDLPNIISVASHDNTGKLAGSSNFGSYIDIAAPGVDIYTTVLNNGYGYANGTSMSAAFVSAAAVVMTQNVSQDDITPEYIVNALKYTAVKSSNMNAFGRLDISSALEYDNSLTQENQPISDGTPQDVLDILSSNLVYTSLTDGQKQLLLDYLCLRDDTMITLAEMGYTVAQSEKKLSLCKFYVLIMMI